MIMLPSLIFLRYTVNLNEYLARAENFYGNHIYSQRSIQKWQGNSETVNTDLHWIDHCFG